MSAVTLAPAGTSRQPEFGTHSPCVGVCDLDPQTGWCRGCARTGVEISSWPGASAAQKQAVWSELPARLRVVGAPYHLEPWSPAGILDWIAATVVTAPGSWWIGGATGCGTAVDLTAADRMARGEQDLALCLDDVAVRFTLHDKWRAFAFGDPDQPSLVALVLPKGRVTIAPAAGGVLALGPDARAIAADDRDLPAFDLGVGRDGARVVLRTGDPTIAAGLTRGELRPQASWTAALPTRTHLVHETECARIETAHLPTPSEREASDRTRAALARATTILPGWAALVAAFVPGP